jgi:DNA polymerase III sliding clamp (beta) subunit (PCNA family)
VITRVESACPEKCGRTTVSAIRIESDRKRLRAVATDDRRIAIADASGDWGVFTMLLPKHFLPLIKRRAGATVQFAESEASYFFRTDSVLLQSRKLPAAFPNYRKITDNVDPFLKSSVRVSSADLKSAIINILSILSTDDRKLADTTYAVRGQSLLVSVNGSSMARGSVPVSAEGSEIAIRINSRFILDFLAQVDGEVTVQFSDEDNVVKLSKGDNFHHFVRPLLSEAARRRMEQEAKQAAANRKEEACRRTAEANPIPPNPGSEIFAANLQEQCVAGCP